MYQQHLQQRPRYASGLFSNGTSVGGNDTQRASAASLFPTGFNQNVPLSNQQNQYQFDSFVNDPQQSQNFMSLPSDGSTIAPPPTFPQNRSGPPSLSNVGDTSNPFRSQGRRGHSARTPNTASSLFGNTATVDGFTPVSFAPSNSSNDYLKNSPDVTESFSSLPNIMPIQQPQGFSEYPSSEISEDKRKKAELMNDQLRAEKIANREQNLAKVNEKREAMIKSQNEQWEQIEKEKEQQAVLSSFTNEKGPLDLFQKQSSPLNKVKKPLTKEERREMRDRAKQIRMKRSDRANVAAGDLGSLYDEISSRGASVCSDLSDKHQSAGDGFHQRTDPTGMIPQSNFFSSNHLYHPVSNSSVVNPTGVVNSNTSNASQFFDGHQYQQNHLGYGIESTDVSSDNNIFQSSNEQVGHSSQNTAQLNKMVNSEDNSSGSSYDIAHKSSGSESRLSPYELVDKVNYPSQSSLNSNDSSPLEFIQNVSVASSSYEKVSAPSSSMSFDMGSVDTNRYSANEGSIQVMSNVAANSKPLNELQDQQEGMFSATHGEVTLPPTSSVISDIPASNYFTPHVPMQNIDTPANSNITTTVETPPTQPSIPFEAVESDSAMWFQPQRQEIPSPVVNQVSNQPEQRTSQQFTQPPQNVEQTSPSFFLTNSQEADKQTYIPQNNTVVNSAAIHTSPIETNVLQSLTTHQPNEQFPIQSTLHHTEENIPEVEAKLLPTQTIRTSTDQNLYYNQNDNNSVQNNQFLGQVQNPIDQTKQTGLNNVNLGFVPLNPVNDIHQESTHPQVPSESMHQQVTEQSPVFAQSLFSQLPNENSKLSAATVEQPNQFVSSNYQPSIRDFDTDIQVTQSSNFHAATNPSYSIATSSPMPQSLPNENLNATTSPNMVMPATGSIPQSLPYGIFNASSSPNNQSTNNSLLQQPPEYGSDSAKSFVDGQSLSDPTFNIVPTTSVLAQDENTAKNSQSDAFMFFKSEKQTNEKPVLVSSNWSSVSEGQQVPPQHSLHQHQPPKVIPTQQPLQNLAPQLQTLTSQEPLMVQAPLQPAMPSQSSSQQGSLQTSVPAPLTQQQLPVEQSQTMGMQQPPPPQPLALQQPPTPQPLALQQPTPSQPLAMQQPTSSQPLALQQPTPSQSLAMQQPIPSQPLALQQPTLSQPLAMQQPPPPQSPALQQPQVLPTHQQSQLLASLQQQTQPTVQQQQATTIVNQFQPYGQVQSGFSYQPGTTSSSSSLPYTGQTSALSNNTFPADFQYSQATATIHPTDTSQTSINSLISSPELNPAADSSGLQTQANNFMQPPQEQSLMQQQYQPYNMPYGQNYNDMHQQMYWQHYHQQQMWYANYYNQQQYYDQYQHYGYHPYWGMDPNYDQYSYHSSAPSSMYGDSRPGSVIERRSSGTEEQILNELADLTSEMSFQNRPETPPQDELIPRTTPLSFTRPHVKARFSLTAGIISIVAPKQPLDGEVAFIQNIPVAKIAPNILLTRFPGPLVRKETHKKHIRNFITETIRDHLPKLHTDPVQLFSHVALWEFVNLLVKQNGTFDGSDVADLLVSLLPVTEVNGIESRGLSTLANPPQNVTADELEEFHTYISTGRTRDAVDIAIRSGLWGHAFMLSYSLGEKWTNHVQNRFLMGLRKTDPMKTLYAHLQNKDLSYIKKRANPETWAQNLCVLISQGSNQPDRDKEKIIVFGDALREQGLIAAAQLCYLVAKLPFGKHTCKEERLVLLGLDHQNHTAKPSRLIAKDLPVQLTEIYQYALTLHDQSYVIPSFQPYKFDYATQLIECGYSSEGLAYLESIGIAINNDRTYTLYKSEFVRKLIKMAEQLFLLEVDKYDELEEIPWLQNVKSYCERAVNAVSPDDEAGFNNMIVSGRMCSSTNLSDPIHTNLTSPEPVTDWSAEGSSNELSSRNEYTNNNEIYSVKRDDSYTFGNQPYQPVDEVGQTPYPNHGLDSTDGSYEPSPRTAIEPSSTNDTYESNSRTSSGVYATNAYDYTDYGYTHPVDSTNPPYEDQQVAPGLDQPDQQYLYEESSNNLPGQFDDSGYRGTNNANQQTQPYYAGEQYDSATATAPSFFNPAQFTNTETPSATSDAYSYDNQYDNSGEESRRESFATNNRYEEEEEAEDLFGDFTKKKNTHGGVSTPNVSKNDVKAKPEPKKASEAKEKKGWLGGILSKFSRGKEVHLPDDKDKSLVYDENLKRWVDKNADPAEESKPLPPPPMAASHHVSAPSHHVSAPHRAPSMNDGPPTFGTPATNITPENAPNASVPPVQQMERPSAKQAARNAMLAKRNSRNNMAKVKTEEEKKPSGPPSKFSLKAQGGRRGTGRYINVMGNATKSTPMAPVLDPFSSTPNSGNSNQFNQPGGSNMPMTFFDPSKMSNPAS